ncbi:LysE family transporter [Candidatus Dependentiae bacterium]
MDILLIFFGIYFIYKSFYKVRTVFLEGKLGIILTMSKSFILTIINPLVLIFFMLIGVQILPDGVMSLSLNKVVVASIIVSFGSLLVLTIVSVLASIFGKCISQKKLKFVSFITGIIFIIIGIIFLDHIFLGLFPTNINLYN